MSTLKKIQELYKSWQDCQPLPEENHKALWQWIRMHFNHLSNHFEGNTLTYSETQMLLIHGRAVGNHELRAYEEMKAHDLAFEYTCQLAKEAKLVTEADIRDFNKICLKEPFYKVTQTLDGERTKKKITPGQYKTQPNHVLTKTGEIFRFASPESTASLMAELVRWIQSQLKKKTGEQQKGLVSFLAELHRRFVLIHPFDDGNGRVIRLLINYVLIRLDFLPMCLDHRENYIKAIQFSDTGDMSHLENLFANNIILMLKKGLSAKTHLIDMACVIDKK